MSDNTQTHDNPKADDSELLQPSCCRAIWNMRLPDKFLKDHWTYIEEDHEVEVMAIVDGWVMARRPGCAPFVQQRDNFTFDNSAIHCNSDESTKTTTI